jgi:hypothetical protein
MNTTDLKRHISEMEAEYKSLPAKIEAAKTTLAQMVKEKRYENRATDKSYIRGESARTLAR